MSETYKDHNGNWVSPDEIITKDGEKFLESDSTKKIKVGPSESMSKSKKNTIDPEKIIKQYGADAVRLFILSDSPPEKDVQWSEEGISASYKFIQKLWTLNMKVLSHINMNHKEDKNNELEKYTNKFLKKMTENLKNFNYNIIIANMHEMYSFLIKDLDNEYNPNTLVENYMKILISITPVVPHFANECLEMIGKKQEKHWPIYDEKLLEEKELQIVVQINGKKRGLIKIERDLDEKKIYDLILENEKIKKHLSKVEIKKKIYVKNRLINLII